MKPIHEAMADKMDEAAGSPDDGSDGDDYKEGLKAAVSSFIDAVHSKDVDAAVDALHQAVELCAKVHSEPDGDEGGGHAALLLMPHPKG